ncbi:hypothetical protein AB669_00100 [Pedobacter sp. BMA]|nr:hypothetical protein AB669_00100 [Pedobacter sp. BMA]
MLKVKLIINNKKRFSSKQQKHEFVIDQKLIRIFVDGIVEEEVGLLLQQCNKLISTLYETY